MTQWGLDTLFNPAKRHMDEEKRRLQATREEIGDSSGGKRIDLESGKVTIRRAKSKDAADEVTRGRSALVVAHRLDQASQADNILVMDGGEIVERGTHDELLAGKGIYHRLWSAWSAGRRELDAV